MSARCLFLHERDRPCCSVVVLISRSFPQKTSLLLARKGLDLDEAISEPRRGRTTPRAMPPPNLFGGASLFLLVPKLHLGMGLSSMLGCADGVVISPVKHEVQLRRQARYQVQLGNEYRRKGGSSLRASASSAPLRSGTPSPFVSFVLFVVIFVLRVFGSSW